MGIIETNLETFKFPRARTLALLEAVEKEPQPLDVLAWRPGPGRAHIGWQLAHIAVTEEILADRLVPDRYRAWEELWPRFRGGSVPDDNVPGPAEIRDMLVQAREHISSALLAIGDQNLEQIPEAFQARGWRIRDVLSLIAYHEAHHHGQAHLTFNLYKAQLAPLSRG